MPDGSTSVGVPSPYVGIADRYQRTTTFALRVLAFAAFALAWEIWARAQGSLLIPTFVDTAQAFASLITEAELWRAVSTSNVAMVIGYLICVVTALPVGFLMARWRAMGRAMNTYCVLLLSIPIAPLTPIIIVALGIDLQPRVLVVVLFAWPFIALNARTGVRTVDQHLVQMAHSFGSGEWQLWRKVLLPGAMPAVMAGLRLGLARAIAGMVIVELLMVPAGIGGLLNRYRSSFQSDLVYAVVVVVILEALLLIFGMRALQRRVVPWTQT